MRRPFSCVLWSVVGSLTVGTLIGLYLWGLVDGYVGVDVVRSYVAPILG